MKSVFFGFIALMVFGFFLVELPGNAGNSFQAGEWRWLNDDKEDHTNKVIVIRNYTGTIDECILNMPDVAVLLGGPDVILESWSSSRYVTLNGREIADIGCDKGLQSVTATLEYTKKLNPIF